MGHRFAERTLVKALLRGLCLLALVLAAPLGVSAAAGQSAAAFELLVSASPDRSGAVALEDASTSGNAYVFVSPEAGATQVRFWIDNPSMSGTPFITERNAPWDLAGGNKDGTA